MQTALIRSYFGTKVLGYSYKMVGIPGDVNIGSDVLAFDPAQMRAAFDAGRALYDGTLLGKPFRSVVKSFQVQVWSEIQVAWDALSGEERARLAPFVGDGAVFG